MISKRMTFKEYQRLAPATMADLRIEELDGAHLTLGMFTEIGELQSQISLLLEGKTDDVDVTNVKEEVGDLLWYIACLCDLVGMDMEELAYTALAQNIEIPKDDLAKVWAKVIYYSSELADDYKKRLAYKKMINRQKQTIYTAALIQTIEKGLCPLLKVDVHRAMFTNIAKLKERYGDKFVGLKAIKRDTAEERKILERE
jgi:NTP pyrophosphatase (non-canonical NTP hydrolase)